MVALNAQNFALCHQTHAIFCRVWNKPQKSSLLCPPRSFVCDVAGFNPVRVQKGLSIFGFIFKQNLTSQLAITFIPPPWKCCDWKAAGRNSRFTLHGAVLGLSLTDTGPDTQRHAYHTVCRGKQSASSVLITGLAVLEGLKKNKVEKT